MNYIRIYNQLIDLSRNCIVIVYTEKHHIIPRCIGGTDDIGNIAILTAEEIIESVHIFASILVNEDK